jgi:hypothetical protein
LAGEVAENLSGMLTQKIKELDEKIDGLEISPALACGASVPDLDPLFVPTNPTKQYNDL